MTDDVTEGLAPLLDQVEKGLVARVAGGALVSGLLWGALGALVAALIGWVAPQIPKYPYTWIASVVTAFCAVGPCAVVGWWAGFAGGVAKGIAQVAAASMPPVFERTFDRMAARFDGSGAGTQVQALEDAIQSVTEQLHTRARAVADRRGEGVMARFRAGLFTRAADAIQAAYNTLDVPEGSASMAALRPRFVTAATEHVVSIFERQHSRLRAVALTVWLVAFGLAVGVLLIIK